MTMYKIGVLNGDGIGPEIVPAAVKIFAYGAEKLGIPIEWIELPMGWEGIEKYDDPLPEITMRTLETCHGWILGPHDSVSYPPEHKKNLTPGGRLRHELDLYANIRPAKSISGINSLVQNVDLIICRENTEGFYADRNMFQGYGEWKVTEDVVMTAGVFTRKAIERIAHTAFQLALTRRKKVTVVHKGNVFKMSMGLFLEICQNVGKQYPEVTVDDYHIDAMAARLVRCPSEFDVIVTENMFGDILSDLAAELVGSLGLAPSINANDKIAMAQAAHGSAPDIAGKNIANPTGIILSTVMLFDWLSEKEKNPALSQLSKLVEKALYQTIQKGIKTKDLEGDATTSQFVEGILVQIKEMEEWK